MTIEQQIAHITGGRGNNLNICFNLQWGYYSTIEKDWSDRHGYNKSDLQECIDAEAIWSVQYYPRTPGASIETIGPTLPVALSRMVEALKSEEVYDCQDVHHTNRD